MKRGKPVAFAGVALAIVAILVASSAGLAASSEKKSSKAVTLVWWHNANQGAGLKLWQQVAQEFHAQHPDVTIKAGAVPERAPCRTRRSRSPCSRTTRPTSSRTGAAAQLVDQVKAKKVANMTKYVAPWIKSIGGSAAGWQVNGQQYAVPYSVGVVGFWYNKDALQAGRDHRGAEDMAAVASPRSAS